MKKYRKIILNLILLLLVSFCYYCCKPEDSVALIETSELSSVTEATVICGGEVTSEGSSKVTARGVCWSKFLNPTILDSVTIDSCGIGKFSSNISGLSPGTTYYLAAYATNKSGTSYGRQISFTTKSLELSTIPISDITATSVISGGVISSEGDSTSLSIIESGVCWNTLPNPTTNDFKASINKKFGSYTCKIIELKPNTTYFIKSYIINSAGIFYGNEISFTTLNGVIELTTNTVSAITAYTAISGGTISFDGGADITEKGICWSINANPSIEDNKTVDGFGIGIYTSALKNLLPGTSYYVRSYATNCVGTFYGNVINFFSQNGIIKLSTIKPTKITAFTAISGGEIFSDGGANVTERGICWNENPNPTTSNNKSRSLSSTNLYTAEIIGLKPETNYYLKAFAINGIGTSYGNEVIFRTQPNTDGTEGKPYTVYQAIHKQDESNKWVTGYIVGYINTVISPYKYTYSSGPIYNNILIADNASTNTDEDCLPVQLTSGTEIRNALNVGDNPDNIGRRVSICGSLQAYFGVPGLKTPTYYVLEGGSGRNTEDIIFSEEFINTLGDFSAFSVDGDQTWKASSYGAMVSGFASSVNNPNEDWLISPAINLTNVTSSNLSFNHTINKGIVANMHAKHTLWFSTNYISGAPSTATWTQVTIPTFPTGADWTFVSSGKISLPAAVYGKSNVHFAFKYVSTTYESSTWEIEDLVVSK